MNTVLTKVVDENDEIIGIDINDELCDRVVESLMRNNTFCPNIDRVIFNTDISNEDNPILATVVYFKDGTKTTVKNCSGDKITLVDEEVKLSDGNTIKVKTADQESKEAGVAYAILKRLVCDYDDNGRVQDKGFITFLKKVVKNAYCQNVEDAKTAHENKIAKARAKENAKVKGDETVAKRKASLRSVVKDLSETIIGLKGLVDSFKCNKEQNESLAPSWRIEVS